MFTKLLFIMLSEAKRWLALPRRYDGPTWLQKKTRRW